MAKQTIEQVIARAIQLYEQEPGEACASSRFGLYVRRWVRWARTGFRDASSGCPNSQRQGTAVAGPRPVIANRRG